MPRFRVTFRKTVYDATGHAHDICQRIVEVEARDCGSARDAAIACFCDRERITHWLNHADTWRSRRPSNRLPIAPCWMAGRGARPDGAGRRGVPRTVEAWFQQRRKAPPWPRRGSTQFLQGPLPCPSFVSTPGKGTGRCWLSCLAQNHQGGVSRNGCQFLCVGVAFFRARFTKPGSPEPTPGGPPPTAGPLDGEASRDTAGPGPILLETMNNL